MTMRALLFTFLATLLLLGPGAAAWAAPGRPVALVTDLRGTASRDDGGGLNLLAELAAGARLRLTDQGWMRLLMLADGQQYDLAGPGAFSVQADGPRAEGGGRVTRGAALAGTLRDLRLRPARIAQASLTLRGDPLARPLELVYPVGTRLLEAPDRFTWAPAPGATGYVFQLLEENGRLIHEAGTTEARVELPAGAALKPGGFYAWQVRVRLADGGETHAWAEFGLADPELRQRVEEARAAAGADLSARLLFALWLDQQGLREEARHVWRDLARERPEELRLRALAAER